jgi:hypothetical protein
LTKRWEWKQCGPWIKFNVRYHVSQEGFWYDILGIAEKNIGKIEDGGACL